jgi:hypothetical protein
MASLNIDVSPLDADYVSSPSLSKLNKIQRIEMLIKLRTLFFDKNVTAKARCEAEVKELFAKKYPAFSTESRVRDLLNEKSYCLSDEVFGEERYKSNKYKPLIYE